MVMASKTMPKSSRDDERLGERRHDHRPSAWLCELSKAEGTSNIISDLADEGIFVNPADGLDIETGLQAINSLLAMIHRNP